VAVNDKPFVQQLTKRFAEDGYRLPDLLRSIALSPGFSNVSPRVAPERTALNSTTGANR
jgi:hypothetical protein